MEAKLRSITRRIHWSLAAKAAAIALAWFLLPLWVFCAVALFLYSFPFFRGLAFVPFFLLLVFLDVFAPINLGFMLLVGFSWYLLLGVKDLLLIDRPMAYEALAFISLFLAFFEFFTFVGGNGATLSWLLFSFLIGAAFTFLLLQYGEYAGKRGIGRQEALAAGIGGALVWELALFIPLIPIGVLPATALAFLIAVSMFEFMSQGIFGKVYRKDAFAIFSLCFALSAILLASLSWKF